MLDWWKCRSDRSLLCDYWWVDEEESEKRDVRLTRRRLKYVDVVPSVAGRCCCEGALGHANNIPMYIPGFPNHPAFSSLALLRPAAVPRGRAICVS